MPLTKVTDAALVLLEREVKTAPFPNAAISLVEEGDLTGADSEVVEAFMTSKSATRLFKAAMNVFRRSTPKMQLCPRAIPRDKVPVRCLVQIRGVEIVFFEELLGRNCAWTLDAGAGCLVLLDDEGNIVRPRMT